MLKQMFDQVREKSPLIHNITNYVTVNDCANMVLACGASPIMADDKEEVAEIQTICAGLNINIGTLNSRTIESMKIAGMRANELGHPAVLDPGGRRGIDIPDIDGKRTLKNGKIHRDPRKYL